MAVINPCCCKLQQGVTIVAVINMAISLTALVWYFVTLLIGVSVAIAVAAETNYSYGTGRYDNDDRLLEVNLEPKLSSSDESTIAIIGILLMVITVIFVLSCLITFIMSFILFLGARKKEIGKCRLWFSVTLVFLVIYLCFKLFNIGIAIWAWNTTSGNNPTLIIVTISKEVVVAIFSMAIEGYQLWVVYAFIEELKREPVPQSEGIVHFVPKPGQEPPPYGGQSAPYTPYVATGGAAYSSLPNSDAAYAGSSVGFPAQNIPSAY